MLVFKGSRYKREDIQLLADAIEAGMQATLKNYCTACERCTKRRVCKDLDSLLSHLQELLSESL